MAKNKRSLCPECMGANNFTEVQCSLCDGFKTVSEEVSREWFSSRGQHLQFGKGQLVKARGFLKIIYEALDGKTHYSAPKQAAHKLLVKVQNTQPDTIYMLIGYVYVTVGEWNYLQEAGCFALLNSQKVQIWKATPFNNGLAQEFYVHPRWLIEVHHDR